MKKLILIFSLLIAFSTLKAQPPGIFNYVLIRDSLCFISGGTIDSCVTVIMKDTLINPAWVRQYIEALNLEPGGSSGDLQYNNAGSFDGSPLSTDGTNITMTYVSPPIISSWILDPTYSDPFYYQFTNSTQSALFRLRENRFEITASNSSQYSQFYFGTPIWGNMVLKTQVNTGAHWETRFYQAATLKPALLNRIYAGTDTTNTFFHLLDTAGFHVGFNRDPYNLATTPAQFVTDPDEIKFNYDATSYYNWIAGNNPRIRHNLFTPFFNGLNFEQDSIRFQVKNYLGITNKYSFTLDARNYTSASDLFDLDMKNNLWTYQQRFFNNTTTGGWFMEFERSDLGGSRTWGLRFDTTRFAIEYDGALTYEFKKDSAVFNKKLVEVENFAQFYNSLTLSEPILAATTYQILDGLSFYDYENMTITDSSMIIPIDAYGLYTLHYSMSITSGTNNTEIDAALFKNDVILQPSERHVSISAQNDYYNLTSTMVSYLGANDTIEIKVQASLTATLSIQHFGFFIKKE